MPHILPLPVDDAAFHRCRSSDRASSKEDVWSIGCIMIEMLINTILFRPQNDDPSLQLLCIVRYVGGLPTAVLDRFPSHVKKLFSKLKCDHSQLRLNRLLQQIFSQRQTHQNDHCQYSKENLVDVLKQMFQFQCTRRISLQALLAHPFFCVSAPRVSFVRDEPPLPITRRSVRVDDLVHLCTKLHLEHSRWLLTLKERCLLALILHIDDFSQFNPQQYGLSQPLQFDVQRLVSFLTGLP